MDTFERQPGHRDNNGLDRGQLRNVELSDIGNLKRPGTHHIGALAEITFYPNKEGAAARRTIIGTIVSSSEGRIVLHDFQSGEHTSVKPDNGTNLNEHVESIRMRPNTVAWQKMRTSRPQLMIEALEAMNDPVCLFYTGDAVVTGVPSIKEEIAGYPYVHIQDAQGREHIIDTDVLIPEIVKFVITERTPDLDDIKLKTSDTPIRILDETLLERRALAQKMLDDRSFLASPELYDFLSRDLDATRALLLRHYQSSAKEQYIDVIDAIDERLLPLAVDPGVMAYFDEFAAFLRANSDDLVGVSLIEVRERFSNYLGTEEVYRGMMLTEQELRSIQQGGLMAAALYDKERFTRVVSESLGHQQRYTPVQYGRSFMEEIFERTVLETDADKDKERAASHISMSVSSYREVAESVGYHDSQALDDPAKKMYVLKCRIPKLSAVRMIGAFEDASPSWTLKIGADFEVNEGTDRNVEMFVPYHIPQESIIETIPITEMPPKWKREVREIE